MKTLTLVALLGLGAWNTMSQTDPRMPLKRVLVFEAGTSAPPAGSFRFQGDRGSRKGQAVIVSSLDAPPAASTGTEYHLVASSSAASLPAVDVLGVHYVRVRPERREAFEQYVRETLHPVLTKLGPDLQVLYYKAVRGADAGNYIALFALTRESRDRYWPNGADSDALRAAFKPAQPLAKELLTYLVEGTALTDEKFAARVYESREWADFVLVPPR